MSTASAARLSALDRVLDGQPADETLAEELFAVADALASQASLRRALTDPGTPDDTRGELARALFGSRVGPAATAVVAEAARLRWTGSGMAEALERQGARALLLVAERSGQLWQRASGWGQLSGTASPCSQKMQRTSREIVIFRCHRDRAGIRSSRRPWYRSCWR